MSDEIYININEESNDIIVQVAEFDQVLSVNGETGNVIVDKNTIGLSNVENVSIVTTSGHLQNQINNAAVKSGIVYTTGDQTISGLKTFNQRLLVNNAPVLISGDIINNNIIKEITYPNTIFNYYLTGINDNYILDLTCYGGTGHIYLANPSGAAIFSNYVINIFDNGYTTIKVYTTGYQFDAPPPGNPLIPVEIFSESIRAGSHNIPVEKRLEYTLINKTIQWPPITYRKNYLFEINEIGLEHKIVHTTGNQTISGIKNFATRPTVNGTGVLLSGESNFVTNLGGASGIQVMTTGDYNSITPLSGVVYILI